MSFRKETRLPFSWFVRAGFLLFGLLGATLPGKAQARGAFRADRMDTVLYGVAYYPEYMPYERLDQDVQLMQKAGITVVRIGEFSWGLWEPEDGKFEFAWMDRAVEKLRAAAGLHYQEFSSLLRPLAPKDDPFQVGTDNRVSDWAEMLILDTAKPLAYYDHPFFAKYPAITRNAFGKGTLTYEGTALSDKLQQRVLLDVLKQAGLTGPDQELPVPVRVKHGSNRAGKTLHYYLNYSNDPQKLTYAYHSGMDLLSQATIADGQQVILKPWDAVIVEEK